MTARNFCLKPFPSGSPPPDLAVGGSISRSADSLAVRYRLVGRLEELAIPSPARMPARTHGLWQETCFELFLGVKHAGCYWEFNFSPTGHWNVYRFSAYRQEMREETAFREFPLKIRSQKSSLSLALEVPLAPIAEAGQTLEAGICAVIQDRRGDLTFWALIHSGLQADFHRRDSFTLEV